MGNREQSRFPFRAMKIELIPDSAARSLVLSVFCFFCEKPDTNTIEIPPFLFPLLIPLLAGKTVLTDIQLPGNYLCQNCADEWQKTPPEESLSAGVDSSPFVETGSIGDRSETDPTKQSGTL